jgi:hypothetical protein
VVHQELKRGWRMQHGQEIERRGITTRRTDMTKAKRPRITLFLKDPKTVGWVSEGWYRIKDWGKPEAKSLYRKASKCIHDGKDIQDVIQRLRKAGFTVRYVSKYFGEQYLADHQFGRSPS